MTIKQKDDRIDVRVKKSQKNYLVHVATMLNMKLSAFVLNCAMKEAEEIVNQNVNFALPEKQWKAFCAALDQPAKEIPQLKKLFAEPSIFNEQKATS